MATQYNPDDPYDDEYYRGLWGSDQPTMTTQVIPSPADNRTLLNQAEVASNPSAYQSRDPSAWETLSQLGSQIGGILQDPTVRSIGAGVAANVNRVEDKQLQEQLRRQAVDQLYQLGQQIGNQMTPELSNYIQRVQRAVSQGEIDPGQALASVQQNTEMSGIKIPDEIKQAQNETLSRLGQVADQGYTAIERAAIQKALDQVTTQTRGEQEAIKNDLMSRGQWGNGQELVQRQMSAQAAANKAAQQGLDIESEGLKRALSALTAKGDLATTMNKQSFDQQASVAGAQDTINKLNATLATDVSGQNAARQQQAAQQDIANRLAVQQQNMAQDNVEQQRRADLTAKEEEQKLARQRAGLEAAAQAGGNAGKMWTTPYTAQQQAQQQATQAVGNATAPSNGQSGNLIGQIGSAIDTGKKLWDAGSRVVDWFSDPDTKENKKQLSDDDISDILNNLVPTKYTYKKQYIGPSAAEGQIIGIMSTDLAKTPHGKQLLGKDDSNHDVIHPQKAISLALAALSSLSKRIDKLEE